jgi:catechol 2,3-dioxygenase-like lactoylglutathione lyase family enzyme
VPVYYDEFMPLVGYMPYFGTGYVPTDWNGAQIFLYPSTENGEHSRLRSGLSHIAFLVNTREQVHRVHEWVVARGDEVLNEPKPWPEYGQNFYATYFLDPHGFMLEVVCLSPSG